MRTFLLLCFIFYANAQIVDSGKGLLVHLGPFDTSYQIGNFTQHYVPDVKDFISSRNARILVEHLRRLFKVGFNVYPPLDPYTRITLPPLSLDNYLDLVKGQVDFHNLVIAGAQRFNQNVLELHLKSGKTDFEFTIPSLNFDVDLQANLLLADTLSYNFTEHLSLVLSGVRISGAVHAVPTKFGDEYYFQVVALSYHLHIDDVAVQLNGSNDKINKLIKDSLLLGINIVRDNVPANILTKLIYNVNKNAAEVVLQEANNMFFVANTKQILAYLLPNYSS